jgi:NAD(P)H-hydrate epimerase
MASGGMGDVLAGVIGALLAQGLSPFDAACFGVYAHGAAADAVAARRGQVGLLAGDVLDALPPAIARLQGLLGAHDA